uniref:FecR family protein n=1 Tax=Pedobacter schmidteae TaxID=2201271 RepID=UPI0013CE84CF|nr:FecR family protein [Pedobacter schmidteae]
MDHLKVLFKKYINDRCTTAEIELLMQAFNEAETEAELKSAITLELQREYDAQEELELDAKMLKLYEQLKPELKTEIVKKPATLLIGNYIKYSIAAAVLIICSVFIYRYSVPANLKDQVMVRQQQNDVAPGGNKAILTLADGTEISLTDAENGELTKQSGIVVTKTADGQIVYQITGEGVSDAKASAYNTITTPAGGQYQINLQDGSTVWLNAGSSLKYPTIFNTHERKVELKGEAYFEIVKDKTKPFVVFTNGAGKAQEVTVLGTHFNINCYDNEETTKTTLLEGSVKVKSGSAVVTLRPGQESRLAQGIQINDVDPNLAIDWKNGGFYFNDEDIYSIMRKLARWYDVEVVYKGNVPAVPFGAEIDRSKKLSEVLSLLEKSGGIHFKIEGRRVTVMQ